MKFRKIIIGSMAIFALPFKCFRKITALVKWPFLRKQLRSVVAKNDLDDPQQQLPEDKTKANGYNKTKQVGCNPSKQVLETSETERPTANANVKAFSCDVDQWMIVGASVQGNGHISVNMTCQDSSDYKHLGDGWGIAVVSDGAGSAKNAQIGSGIAVQRALVHFENLVVGRAGLATTSCQPKSNG